jgi:hypothetical protein
MRRTFLAFALAAVTLVAWRGLGSKRQAATFAPPADSPYVKIWVSKAGDIEVDGTPTELSAVGPALATLAQKKGVVLYGRDAAGEEPHPKAMEVIKMVVANRLPIRMCRSRDFSDAVRPDGKLKE